MLDERLQAVFRDVFADPTLILTEATTANEIADWDSLNHLNLIEAMEREFAVRFTTDEMATLQSFGGFRVALEHKIG